MKIKNNSPECSWGYPGGHSVAESEKTTLYTPSIEMFVLFGQV